MGRAIQPIVRRMIAANLGLGGKIVKTQCYCKIQQKSKMRKSARRSNLVALPPFQAAWRTTVLLHSPRPPWRQVRSVVMCQATTCCQYQLYIAYTYIYVYICIYKYYYYCYYYYYYLLLVLVIIIITVLIIIVITKYHYYYYHYYYYYHHYYYYMINYISM